MRISLVLVLLLIALFVIASAQEDHIEVEDVTNTAADSTPSAAFDEDDESDEYEAPKLEDTSKVVFIETFQQDPKTTGWVESKQSKYATQEWKWGTAPGGVTGLKGDKGLIIGREAQHYGISVPVQIDNTNKDLVIQYEVKFEKNLACGGAYIKLLKADDSLNLDTMDDKSPYVIMFGPDHCSPTDKVHFIFRHQNPKTGEWEEKHLKNPPLIKNDALSHLYTLIVRTDNSFEVLIDGESARKGSLLEDFTPAVNPPKEIDDPTDKKPADWVDNEYIDDPEAVKPEDWDENEPQEIEDPDDKKPEDWLDNEPLKIADPEAKMPAEWDEDEDGKWEAPIIDNPVCKQKNNCGTWKPRMIKNPKYKGKWKAPLIKNPEYKGVWSPRKIANPAYFEDKHPHNFPKIGALAIEIWTMQKNILFDNFLIAYDENVARQFAKKTFNIKVEKQKTQLPKPAENEKPDFNAMLEQAKEYVMQYSLPLIGTTVALVLVSLFLCCRSSSSNKVPLAEADTTETETKEEGEGESNTEAASEKKEETVSQTESASSSTSEEGSLKKRKGKKTPKE